MAIGRQHHDLIIAAPQVLQAVIRERYLQNVAGGLGVIHRIAEHPEFLLFALPLLRSREVGDGNDGESGSARNLVQ